MRFSRDDSTQDLAKTVVADQEDVPVPLAWTVYPTKAGEAERGY